MFKCLEHANMTSFEINAVWEGKEEVPRASEQHHRGGVNETSPDCERREI